MKRGTYKYVFFFLTLSHATLISDPGVVNPIKTHLMVG